MKRSIWQQVYERAKGCCEYCQTCEKITAQPMHVDHIIPGGGDEPDNLCLACANCNLSKHKAITALDPDTESIVALFNPRQQTWSEHFAWRDDGLRIEGLTAVGRATVERLRMNQERAVQAREIWLETGLHPPSL